MLPIFKPQNDSENWVALSDMMTALMMIFLLINVIYMIKVKETVDIPRIFKADEQQLYSQIVQQVQPKLKKWGATLSPDLTVRFNNEDILFQAGSAQLSPEFKQALDEYFPIYLRSLMSPKYIHKIKEIRIEGHTSSFWSKDVDDETAYLNNMRLSQERAQNTLIYLLTNPLLSTDEKAWLKSKFRAIGFSSALTLGKNGKPTDQNNPEDYSTSQRVEFRVVTNTEDQIREIAYAQS